MLTPSRTRSVSSITCLQRLRPCTQREKVAHPVRSGAYRLSQAGASGRTSIAICARFPKSIALPQHLHETAALRFRECLGCGFMRHDSSSGSHQCLVCPRKSMTTFR